MLGINEVSYLDWSEYEKDLKDLLFLGAREWWEYKDNTPTNVKGTIITALVKDATKTYIFKDKEHNNKGNQFFIYVPDHIDKFKNCIIGETPIKITEKFVRFSHAKWILRVVLNKENGIKVG